MVDPIAWRRFVFRCLFLLVCVVVLFAKLLPLDTAPASIALFDPLSGELVQGGGLGFSIPGPDLLYCFTAAFLMRRPRWAPIFLILLTHILADFLYLRPLGLWPAAAILAYEFLRNQANSTAEIALPIEVALVSGAFAAAVLGNALMLVIFAVPQPGFGTTLLHILTTALAYPIVIAITHFMLRVRRARPGELEISGTIG